LAFGRSDRLRFGRSARSRFGRPTRLRFASAGRSRGFSASDLVAGRRAGGLAAGFGFAFGRVRSARFGRASRTGPATLRPAFLTA
ncbi:MAG TPA: hypothetical protein VKB00_09045, partial [Candidatus Limnocylindrales bacterium]|nr:hypothetical protein [Candidatus Limnocylindrales bacterium]